MPGKITKRDPETGRILPGGKELSSEEARKLGKLSAEVRWSTTATVEGLLREEGYSDEDNPAPVYVKIMAEQAVKNHAAMRDWRRLHGGGDTTTNRVDAMEALGHYVTPAPGERCPWCGYWNLNGNYEANKLFGEIIARHRSGKYEISDE